MASTPFPVLRMILIHNSRLVNDFDSLKQRILDKFRSDLTRTSLAGHPVSHWTGDCPQQPVATPSRLREGFVVAACGWRCQPLHPHLANARLSRKRESSVNGSSTDTAAETTESNRLRRVLACRNGGFVLARANPLRTTESSTRAQRTNRHSKRMQC